MIRISLTRFLDYTSKVSPSAKINTVRSIKKSPGYSPATDYWKPLRDAIKNIHEKDLPIETLKELLTTVDEKKIPNYSRNITKYISFIKKHNVEYFPVGKAHWSMSDEIFIGSNPEIGLIIDGKKYYIKNYYKKPNKDTKVAKRNIKSMLTLMQISEKDFQVKGDEKFAVLNLQNGQLIEAEPPTPEDVLELKLEADHFVNTWNNI